MSVHKCSSCGILVQIPDTNLKPEERCPQCGGITRPAEEVAFIPGEYSFDDEAAESKSSGHFNCPRCGFDSAVPADLIGRTAKCPKCEGTSMVISQYEYKHEPTEEDVELDDLVEEEVVASAKYEGSEGLSDVDRDFDEVEEVDEVGGDSRDMASSFMSGGLAGNFLGGLSSGILALFFCLAYAFVVMPVGAAEADFSRFFMMMLATSAIMGLLFAIFSSISFSMAGPEAATCAVLFLMARSMHVRMAPHVPAGDIFATLVAAMAVTALSVGLMLFLLGKLKAGLRLRYIPFQVAGGVLAGVGVIIIQGAFESFCNRPVTLLDMTFSCLRSGAQSISGPEAYVGWMSALVFGAILLIAFGRKRNSFLLAAIMLMAALLGHAGIWFDSPVFSRFAETGGNLSFTLDYRDLFGFHDSVFLSRVRWDVIFQHKIFIVSCILLAAVTAMIRTANLEVVSGRDVDLDGELKLLGGANVLCGACGLMPGSLSNGRSLGSRACGGQGRLAGLLAALICGAALFWPETVVLPKFVPAGLLVYIGLSLIKSRLFDSWTVFTRLDDHLMLVLVFLVTVFLGLFIGLGFGLTLAMLVSINRHRKAGTVKYSMSGSIHPSNVDRTPVQREILKEAGDGILVLRLQGFLFLGNVHEILETVRRRMKDSERCRLRHVVMDFASVGGFGSTISLGFNKMRRLKGARDLNIVFASVPLELEEMLEKGGYVKGGDDCFTLFTNLDYAVEWCENLLLEEMGALTAEWPALSELLEPVFPNPDYIPVFLRCMQKIKVRKGKTLFSQGEKADALYFVESGMVDIKLGLEEGGSLRLRKVGPGAVFGEMGVYSGKPRMATAVAVQPCVLYKLTVGRMEYLSRKAPRLVEALNRYMAMIMAERYNDTEHKIRDILKV